MSLIPIIIQLISGGIGGNIAGALLKKFNLGLHWQFHCSDRWRRGRRTTAKPVDWGRCQRRGGCCGQRARHLFAVVECRRGWRWRGSGDDHRWPDQGADVEVPLTQRKASAHPGWQWRL